MVFTSLCQVKKLKIFNIIYFTKMNRIDFEEPEGKGCLVWTAWFALIVIAMIVMLVLRAVML